MSSFCLKYFITNLALYIFRNFYLKILFVNYNFCIKYLQKYGTFTIILKKMIFYVDFFFF